MLESRDEVTHTGRILLIYAIRQRHVLIRVGPPVTSPKVTVLCSSSAQEFFDVTPAGQLAWCSSFRVTQHTDKYKDDMGASSIELAYEITLKLP
ncbi:hypothetical protein NPIL_519711 [Nephila pilipes]|uniref:Uncharacterized protein n=1 Tax=Nephila pilipes TaxID=299642 RepID=A0A8X6NNF7_NEPPI|nr:hypothetical protein NPIL_519711 [Nephila pilipes]